MHQVEPSLLLEILYYWSSVVMLSHFSQSYNLGILDSCSCDARLFGNQSVSARRPRAARRCRSSFLALSVASVDVAEGS